MHRNGFRHLQLEKQQIPETSEVVYADLEAGPLADSESNRIASA